MTILNPRALFLALILVSPLAMAVGDTPILYTSYGDHSNDDFGSSVSAAGDVNNDGYVDVIVGGYQAGSARVLSGVNGAILYTFYGDSGGDRFGVSVSSAGDVNGDGYGDVIVGASEDDNNGTNSGSARVLSGANGSILYTFNGDSAGDRLGHSVSGAGDVNNDGYGDVIVGAFGDDNNGVDSGSARVLSGANGSILHTFNGDSAGDQLGYAVNGAGDVNNDGYVDMIVGAVFDDNNGADSGSARVLSGANGSILYTFNGDYIGDVFGGSVSGAGDVNNDGYADVIVGANGDDNNAKSNSGSARVFSGANGSILYTFNGDYAGDAFGASVRGAGDVNNDGYADVIVGASQNDNNGSGSGSARVLSGVNGSILYTFNGDAAGDEFGASVSGAGDVNGDSYADVIVGAHLNDNKGINAGSARVFNGKGLWMDTDSDGQNDAVDTDDDNDGMPDMWEALYSGLNILVNDADDDLDGDSFTNLREYQKGTDPEVPQPPLVPYDFDNDADSDILLRNPATGQNVIWLLENGAKASVSTLTTNATTFEVAAILDGDNDRDADILWYDSAQGKLIFWRMENGAKQANVFLSNTTATLDGVGDFDGDGDADILLKTAAGAVKIWTIQNMEAVLSTTIGTPGGTYQVIDTGDFNGNGIDDIVMQNAAGAVRIWQLNSSAQLDQTINVATVAAGYSLKKVGDTDNDGDDDFIFRNDTTGQSVVWEIENGARVQVHTLSGSNAAMSLATATDFDQDGDEDLLFRDITPGNASDGDTIIWKIQDNTKQSNSFLGNNAVTFLLKATLDMDGDGDFDILYRDSGTGQLIGWNMQNGAKAGNYSLGNPGLSWEPRF